MQSFASHILGAEITYTHITEYKYNVLVTVYRDCNECKLAGGGGGTNTKDCGAFELFLNTSGINSCTSKFLKKFSLTRESIEEILPFCPTAVSKCKNDSGLSYGVEAHTFSTEIDFESYKSYENCGFEMYIQLAVRADDIDNLTQSPLGETLYNYSYINPFEKHSSPTFTTQPEILLTVNQASKSFATTAAVTTDSISIHFARPLRGSNNEIDYSDGYSLKRPLTVWCNGEEVKCEANPQANPPIGVTLDRRTGFLAFTPVKNHEKATLVFEVEKWRNISGTMTLISIVRRDILVSVTSYGQHNNPPQLFGSSEDSKSNHVNVCAGENICFDLQAKDAPFIYPDGSYQSANTVEYEWVSQLPGAEIKQVSVSQAPYNKLQVCWKPRKQDVGKTFRLQVKASDNHCPLRASSTTQYTITVHPTPEVHAKLTNLWCGSLQLEADSTRNQQYASINWTLVDDLESTIFTSNKKMDTVRFSSTFSGNLNLTLQSNVGCQSEVTIPIKRDTNALTASFADVLGKTAYCIGDSVHLRAKTDGNIVVNQVYWIRTGDTVSKFPTLSYKARFKEVNDQFEMVMVGQKGQLQCVDVVSKEITVERGPEIEFTPVAPVCEGLNVIDLSVVSSVTGGTWTGIEHDLIESDAIQVGRLGDITEAVQICQEYTTTSLTSGCLSRDTFCLYVVPNPTLNLEKRTVCGATGYFNLTNMDPAMYSFGTYDIDWMVDGKPLASNPLGNPHLIELTGLSTGNHTVIGVYRNEFGCETTDTGVFALLENIDLSHVTDKSLCQGDQTSLNNVFGIDLGGGFWTSPTTASSVIDNTIVASECGSIDLQFTYDQFGCYVTHEVNLDVICKPDVQFDLQDSLCATRNDIDLVAIPNIGSFVGDNVVDNTLQVDETPKTFAFEYQVNKQGCLFIYPHTMVVTPAPTMNIGSGIMSSICEGQSIHLDRIDVENGTLTINSSTRQTVIEGVGNDYRHNPTESEIASKELTLTVQLNGDGFCPIPEEKYVIQIHPKAVIQLLDSQFEGCTPYHFKPEFTYDAEIVDWSNTQIEWNFGDGNKPLMKLTPNNTYKTAGVYSVSLHTVSPEGCVYNNTWLNGVTVHPAPDASFIPSPSGQLSIRQSYVEFTNTSTSVDSMQFLWNFGTGNSQDVSTEESPSFQFSNDTGTYSVCLTVTTDKGCEDKYVQQIIVGPDIRILVPNAFSPNGKGSEITEEFKVIGKSVSNFHIEIFNRWGQQVYMSDNIDEEWDGKSGGRYCEVGVYAYLIQATSKSGQTYEFKGTIHLLR